MCVHVTVPISNSINVHCDDSQSLILYIGSTNSHLHGTNQRNHATVSKDDLPHLNEMTKKWLIEDISLKMYH